MRKENKTSLLLKCGCCKREVQYKVYPNYCSFCGCKFKGEIKPLA